MMGQFRDMLAGQRVFLLLVLLPSLGVGLYSLRYGVIAPSAAPPGIRDVMQIAPIAFAIHALASALALMLGPLQFLPGLRRRLPGLHRLVGRLYVAACTSGALSALALTPVASGGLAATLGFALLALAWLATTLAALRAALRRDFALHRRLMLYSFAMTFAAVTLRLQIPVAIIGFGAAGYPEASRVLAWSAWLPNVAFVWWWLRQSDRRSTSPVAA